MKHFVTMRIHKNLLLFCILIIGIMVSCKYDDGALWKKLNSLENRVENIETQLTRVNTDISATSTIINALENNISITGIQKDSTNNYTIGFSNGEQITIKEGKDAPIIGINSFEGDYYWTQTIDGISSWLTDDEGNKMPVSGTDAITPRLKINNEGNWMISYDNGISYTEITDETGKPIQAIGQNGNDGLDGDSFFKEIKIDGNELMITLTDGTILKLPITNDSHMESENVEVSINLDNIDGLKITSLIDEYSLSKNSYDIRILKERDLPQLIWVKNNDAVIMMSRDFYKDSGNEINAQTTAFALIASHPVFAPIGKKDFSDLQKLIMETKTFSTLCSEVQKSIDGQKDIFDSTNLELITALNNVLEELCNNKTNIETRLWSQITSRATEINIDTYPFNVTPGKDCIEIRNTRLCPPYEYTVYRKGTNNIWEIYESGMLPARDSYGFTDIFKSVGDIHLGEPVTINFSIDGEYDFRFDKTTERATYELRKVLLNDALSIIGCSGSDLIDSAAELGGIFTSNGDIYDYIDYTSKTIAEQRNKYNEEIAEDMPSSSYLKFLDNALKALNKFNAFYNAFKGAANEVARILWTVQAPNQVDFCTSCYENEISSCAQSKLEIVSGNNQEGEAFKQLANPLKVKITSFDKNDINSKIYAAYHQVKFEIITGNGYISQELVKVDSEGYAETYWTLGFGQQGDIQRVRTVIIDVTTGCEISNPKEFIATLNKKGPDIIATTGEYSYNPETNIVEISCNYSNYPTAAECGLTIISEQGEQKYKAEPHEYSGVPYNYSFNINLLPNTTYSYKAYIIYQGIIFEGETKTFTTFKPTEGNLIDLGLSVKWASCNLGANNPEEYGIYFGFSKDMTNICSPYLTKDLRVPTKTDIEELITKCIAHGIIYKGTEGILVIGPNKNSIFIPASGYGNNTLTGLEISRKGEIGTLLSQTVGYESTHGPYPVLYFLQFECPQNNPDYIIPLRLGYDVWGSNIAPGYNPCNPVRAVSD